MADSESVVAEPIVDEPAVVFEEAALVFVVAIVVAAVVEERASGTNFFSLQVAPAG